MTPRGSGDGDRGAPEPEQLGGGLPGRGRGPEGGPGRRGPGPRGAPEEVAGPEHRPAGGQAVRRPAGPAEGVRGVPQGPRPQGRPDEGEGSSSRTTVRPATSSKGWARRWGRT